MEKFKVFVAGTGGSGKTAFLASMYNKMSTELQELGFYLETSPNDANTLINKYHDLTNPDRPWPAGTTEVSEWDFSCRSWSKEEVLFNFCYLDFPGAFINHTGGYQNAQEFNVTQKVEDANSLLFIIDGQKVFNFMQDIDSSIGSLITDIDFLVTLAMRPKKDVPIHFILTKWDILEDKFSLQAIKEKLFTIPQFKNIIRNRKEIGLPTRLIPISAFGKGFADLDSTGKMVKKKSSVVPQPFQVELSIACTLIDGFRVAYQGVEMEKAMNESSKKAFIAAFLRITAFILRAIGFGARNLNTALPGPYQLGPNACSALLSTTTRRLELKRDELELEIARVQSSLINKESGLDSAIKKCDLLSLQLQQDFPASNLTTL